MEGEVEVEGVEVKGEEVEVEVPHLSETTLMKYWGGRGS